MTDALAKKPTLGQIALMAPILVGGVVAARYIGARKVSAAERLAESLLDTEALREAALNLPDRSETSLARCAAYAAAVAQSAASGIGIASGANDPIGVSRTHDHAYTRAVATVLTEANAPEQILTYAVVIPTVGEVRGTRRVGSQRLSGLAMARPTPDVLQIVLTDGYTAQLESTLETTDYLLTGRNRVFGAMTLRDNRGNVGRLNIGHDGVVVGTITRGAQVVGRFDGKIATGLNFKLYEIPTA